MSVPVKTLALSMALGLLFGSMPAVGAMDALEKKKAWHKCLLEIYRSQQKFPEMLAEYGTLCKLSPNDAQLLFQYGATLYRQGRTNEAITQYRKAAALNPQNPDYQGAVGDALAAIKDYQGAIAAYRKAGPRYAPRLQSIMQYVQNVQQIEQYNKEVKRRQMEDE
ncbi:MAG TPA: tetratricopeptide repeat protein [Candidatus Obscuribacterales bacterium]